MMGGITECCKECNERHIGCHPHCEKYLAAKDEWEKRKKLINDDLYNPLYKHKISQIREANRRRLKHGK